MLLPVSLVGEVPKDTAQPSIYPHTKKKKSNEQGSGDWQPRRGWQKMKWLDGITNSVGHGFEQTLGDSGGQRSLPRYSPWGCKQT